MDSQEVIEIQEKINQMENSIKAILESRPLYTRIIILGLTGAGKSSIACCLANKKCTVELFADNFPRLSGEGIYAGSKVGTEEPTILIDDDNELLFCDCPGFADVRGMKNEIINAFADDCIFNTCNQAVKIKILLVVSVGEIESQRGKNFLDTINRMKKIFPDPEELKRGIGLVLTKGKKDIPCYNYFKLLNERPLPELKNWCDFFITFSDEQVFTFPLAEKEDIGKVYNFSDCNRILEFLKYNPLINPQHRVAIGNDALNELKIIKKDHLVMTMNAVEDIFLLVNEEYRKQGNSTTLTIWLNNMHLLLDKQIKTANDFILEIQKIVPNNEQLNSKFQVLNELATFDSFIDKICEMKSSNSNIQESIVLLSHSAIKELENLIDISKNAEMLEKINQEKKELIAKYESDIKKQQFVLNELKNKQNADSALIRKMEENINYMMREKDQSNQKMKRHLFNQSNIIEANKKDNRDTIQELCDRLEKEIAENKKICFLI